MDNNADEEIARLLNAVRQAGEALTCVVVESEAQARELVSRIANELGDRPYAQCAMVCSAARNGEVLDEARQASGAWPQGEGVLFLRDETPIDVANEDRVAFWRAMNLQREHWAALTSHVIFLLKPGNYTLLISAADHLLSWMPLKFDVRRPAPDEPWLLSPLDTGAFRSQRESPREAAKTLAALEVELGRALAEGEQSPVTLARRFYLPMIEAALDARDVGRAALLLRQVSEDDLPDADLPRWHDAAFLTGLRTHRLDEAERAMRRLLDWADKHSDGTHMALAALGLGLLAEQRHEYESAEGWYRENIGILKRIGYESGVAMTYLRLGVLAWRRREYGSAEGWFRKGIEVAEQLGREHEAARIYQEWGALAQERRDFESAEVYLGRCMEIRERLGDEPGVARASIEIGSLARRRRDFETAQLWYERATAIQERLGDGSGAAFAYQQLGLLASDRGDLASAEDWYRKGLAIYRRLGMEVRAGAAHMGIGMLLLARGSRLQAARELAEAARAFQRFQVPSLKQDALDALTSLVRGSPDSEQKEILALLAQHGLSLPDVASTPTDEETPSEPTR